MIMNENTIHLAEVPIGGKDGFVWNRLHEEREDICEALSKDCKDQRELLQSRLRKVDDALDRLMSGSYSHRSH
jgi:hypothetical protein